ncbi:metalloregulator ArsR/SmtB family transcription factor [soil metagenome]
MDKLAVYDALADVVKAMGNARRLELIELLAQGEHPVDSLSRLSGMGVTTVSAGLQILKQAGLVKTRRERTTVFYRLAGADVAELYVAAKRVGLKRYPELRESLSEYMGQAPAGSDVPLIDPAAVTSVMTVIDVRPRIEFDAGHFPGAVSIPLEELPERHEEVPASGVVVYCRGEFCRMAREAAAFLRHHGVDAVAMYEGVIEWRATQEYDLNDIA